MLRRLPNYPTWLPANHQDFKSIRTLRYSVDLQRDLTLGDQLECGGNVYQRLTGEDDSFLRGESYLG
jgi:hypothetical protein